MSQPLDLRLAHSLPRLLGSVRSPSRLAGFESAGPKEPVAAKHGNRR
jgi:hypothetical protein